ncbi:hypothetical protein BMR06_04260 [Methylococcaceae bacterium HT5]|nr:hypothetical protein BMR06_04260 [Methylococcaceae bacterium HT5]
MTLKFFKALTSHSRHKWFIRFFLFFIILIFSVLLITDPILQKSSYHLLADTRPWLFIPNFADVISNLPFALIGLAGLFHCLRINKEISLSWRVFLSV